jgi:hypothetical protein
MRGAVTAAAAIMVCVFLSFMLPRLYVDGSPLPAAPGEGADG